MRFNTSRHTLYILAVLVVFTFTACEKLTIPVISDLQVTESEAGIVTVTALMQSKQIDEQGVLYSRKVAVPSITQCDGNVTGTLEAGGTFTATLSLEAGKDYYITVFATNEIGTTTSEVKKIHTSLLSPSPNDNPFPTL